MITAENRKLRVALSLAVAAKLAFLAFFARDLALIMDEFAHGYAARFVDQGLYTNVQPIKSALPWLAFNAALSLAPDAVAVLHWLRFEALLIALAMTAAVGVIVYRTERSVNAALFATFVLLSFSNFIEHATSVRNDTFATLFCVLSFGALMAPVRTTRSELWSGALIGGAFLCTQKVAYHVVAIGLGHLIRAWLEGGFRSASIASLRYGLGASASIALYCVGFSLGGASPLHVLDNLFFAPLRASDHVLSGDAFPHVRQYIVQTLSRNALAYGLCALGMLAIAARARTPQRVAGIAATCIITLLIFKHPQPWPYVFVMCVPFLAPWSPAVFRALPDVQRELWMAVAGLALAWSFVRNSEIVPHDNAAQLAVVRDAERLLAPGERYFDGIAMIPTRVVAGESPWWWWDAPTLKALRAQLAAGNREHIDAILRDQPKVWIINYRFAQMTDVLGPVWRNGTVQISRHLLISGRQVKAGATIHFDNYWTGAYRWTDLHGRALTTDIDVDGKACPVPCRIAAGQHTLTSTLAADALLLPADVVLPARPAGEGAALFSAVYDF